MSEQEKQALTPEEFVARKGDVSVADRESPCGGTSATKPVRAAHDATPSANDSRSIRNAPDTIADATPHV
ncbi:MAG TPA: hypothetical protein VIG44_07750 [Thermomicrobiales bacterium]|jgi:hypothetical protein